ncbi:DUF4838 domain-containing protein [Carboxydochorda subterranea]|uniref:DUF4838 domain-containing protein n=1 Tax=Carboxydichorda subterranea TaxID=3109565 RepID=A0ABZ1BXB7_9FIRM|nr:DUF4838 domain-containing protein [Limnochorda sp. L945t]WRP17441.1 DUF4838 domain-containing protein [Limnochorda sp. L945t]
MELIVAADGRSAYRVVLPSQATVAEERAASVLQHYIHQVTGARLPVVRQDFSSPPDPGEPLIFVGLPGFWLSHWGSRELGAEEVLIQTFDRHLLLAGGRPRGTLYAVYTFLEEYVGCRWYTAENVRVPSMGELALQPIHRRVRPDFEYREIYYWEAFDKEWAVVNRLNGGNARLDESVGGAVRYHPFVHTFYHLIPPDRYFATHPEYFSLVGGRRKRELAQLCLTNPGLVETAKQRLLEWAQEHPEATIYSVSQNDWGGWCECPQCDAVRSAEGGESGLVIRFANALAETLEQHHPDKLIDTLAYMETENVPLLARPRPNVIVRLCHMAPSCDLHPLDECQHNARYWRNVLTWTGLGARVYVWHYVTDFAHYLMPFPNFAALAKDVKNYRDAGIRGIFFQGHYEKGGGGEFAWLRSYVLAHLMWNASQDADTLVNDFIEGVYGAAAEPVREYYDLLAQQARREDIHLNLYSNLDAGHLTAEFRRAARQALDRAARMAGNELEAKAVERLSLSLDYVDLMDTAPFTERGRSLDSVTRPHKRAQLDRFMAALDRHGIVHCREGESPKEFRERVGILGQAHPLAVLENPHLKAVLAASLGGRIRELYVAPPGADGKPAPARQVLRLPGRWEYGYPAAAGYAEQACINLGDRAAYVQEIRETPEGSEARLSARLEGLMLLGVYQKDLQMERRIAVPREGAELRFWCEVTNAGEAQAYARPTAIGQFTAAPGWRLWAVDDPASVRPLSVTGDAGRLVLKGEELPGAGLILEWADGLALAELYPPEKVQLVQVEWNTANQSIVLKLVGFDRKLSPGERANLDHLYRFAASMEGLSRRLAYTGREAAGVESPEV